jgi:CelD/BcsL family acetyltransferase involved in cellulose biosynthesis
MEAPSYELLEPRDARWDALVAADSRSLPFHRAPWVELVAGVYGLRPFVVATADGGLPVVAAGDRFRGRRWVALPFTDLCPPVLLTDAAGGRLGAALAAAAAEAGVERVEVRAPVPGSGLVAAPAAVRHVLDLAPGADAIARGFGSSLRRAIRKASASGLTVRVADEERDVTEAFYSLHARTRRRLGVPVQPRRFFRDLWRQVLEPGHGNALLVLGAGGPAAAAIFLTGGSTVVYKYGASDERHWSLRPNNLLFADAIERACESGARWLDFGRSDFADEGLRRFKLGWGAVEEPLVYSRSGAAPAHDEQPSVAFRLATGAIRRAPLWVGRAVGEALYRYAA